MRVFRKLYYKLTTLFCFFAMFGFLFNMDSAGPVFGALYILIGMLSFGALSIGKRDFDPEKPVRNILLYFAWSLLGFSIMATGIATLLADKADASDPTMFLLLPGFGLFIAYIVTIFVTKDWLAILAVLLAIGGFVIGFNSNGVLVLQILTLVTLGAAILCFILSLFKGLLDDDDD